MADGGVADGDEFVEASEEEPLRLESGANSLHPSTPPQLLLREQESRQSETTNRAAEMLQDLAGAAEDAADASPTPGSGADVAAPDEDEESKEMYRHLELVRRTAQEDPAIRKPALFDEVG
jgi:hypothetical protein